MSDSRDVLVTEKVTGTGAVFGGEAVDVTAIYVAGTGTQGQFTLTSGNGGDLQLDVDTPGANRAAPVNFPEGKIPFPNGCYVGTFNNLVSVTLFFRKRT